jgi:uncharacterized damage-inducible protein DinB
MRGAISARKRCDFMQQVNDKESILQRIIAARRQLEAVIAPLSPAQMTTDGAGWDWSVRDHLAHIAWWQQITLAALRGEECPLKREGETWQQTMDRVNAEIHAASQHQPIADVLATFRSSYEDMVRFVTEIDPAALTDKVAERIAGDSYEHDDEHRQMIEAWRNAESAQP